MKSIEELERCDNDLHDYSWVTAALDKVLVARIVLSSSYVFAYYMFGNEMFREEITEEQNNINKDLFEDQQQMLEQEVVQHSLFISYFLQLPFSFTLVKFHEGHAKQDSILMIGCVCSWSDYQVWFRKLNMCLTAKMNWECWSSIAETALRNECPIYTRPLRAISLLNSQTPAAA